MPLARPDLSGRTAFVTGGRRGIGRAIARRLAAHGASIVIGMLHRGEDRLEETIDLFARAGHPLAIVECDLADPVARGDLIARAAAAFGPIDILINNAAGNPRKPPSAMTLADRRAMFELNLHAPVDLAQQALPAMRERGWGRILNLLSDSMHQPPIPYGGPADHVHGTVIYGASKSALARYTQGLAAELQGSGIAVNGLYPHKVCVTEENSEVARTALRAHPEMAESVEMMAEAALLLICGPLTGMTASSRSLLHSFQQPLHALDGVDAIGDFNSIPELGRP
ncbi:SDR family NAD(P)-dependent oxidoreductase [Flavisphingomonas formosensis]|uniref:SDR family NAD(P)-dependent oxidoreductase n=1 Tax=Flavisphingomonas formosensis TaxID=861534 RepID=UPI0012F8DB54|nr:SDR family oxidoreductase [Sphingomonas formosensis]